MVFAAGIDFTLNILAEGFEGSRSILLLSPKAILYIFISIDVFARTSALFLFLCPCPWPYFAFAPPKVECTDMQ